MISLLVDVAVGTAAGACVGAAMVLLGWFNQVQHTRSTVWGVVSIYAVIGALVGALVGTLPY